LGIQYGDHAEESASHLGRTALSVVATVATVVVISWALRTFVVQNYEIPSGSMESTIMTGDMIFSEKISYKFSEPQPGDIITFADPENSYRTLIKRVIATGGQTVDLIDGKVYVDGVELNEPYIQGLASYPLTTAPGVTIAYPYTVPEGEVWVMGDNRTNSQDSRYFGSVSVESITGKAVFRYWPLSNIGSLD
jgi:signal peptidase I